MPRERLTRVSLVVLGDVGRSPRMQYHALALASEPVEVDVVGYPGSAVISPLREHPRIRWHWLGLVARGDRRQSLARALFRVVGECVQLSWLLLWTLPRPDVILIQNPPAVPTLLIALVAARLRAARLVVDWHNFGFAMLGLRLGPRHPIVALAAFYERVVGRRADAHLCVSRAMRAVLARDWRVGRAVVLHDRPAERFAPTPADVRRALFRRLGDTLGIAPDGERCALVVSSTSWTADEDFSVLLDAVRRCDELIRRHEASADPAFPPLVVVITGRGPLRAHYEAEIARLDVGRIRVRTAWLEPDDYPLLLGAADLGLCLHRSASGLDLPMKLADMFGSGLPVCALDYGPCLAEQVEHGVNGLLFTSGAQLAEQLYTLFEGFPGESPLLSRLRGNVVARAVRRWGDEWRAVARPLFEA